MRHLQICFALTIGNHMFCQAALRSILFLDRLATAEACIRLEPNNVSVDIGSGLQKFIIIIIINMPSVAIQTAMGAVLPLVEPGSPREPKQREGPWTDWQHASYKPRTRRGGMVRRYIQQGRWCPHVKLMKHRSVNTNTKNTASFKTERRTTRTDNTSLMSYPGPCLLQTRVEADAVEIELLEDLRAAIMGIRFWRCIRADLDVESTAVSDINIILWVSRLPTISL